MPKPKSDTVTTDNHKQQNQPIVIAPDNNVALEPVELNKSKLPVIEIYNGHEIKSEKFSHRIDGKNSKKTKPLTKEDVHKMAEHVTVKLELIDAPVTARALPGLLRILSKTHTISLSVDVTGNFICTAKAAANVKPLCIIRIDADKIHSVSFSQIINALTEKPVDIEKHLIISGITSTPILKLDKNDEHNEENDDAFLKLLRDTHITYFSLSHSLLNEAASESLAVRIGRVKRLKKIQFENVDFATQTARINFFKRVTLQECLSEIILRHCGLDDNCIIQGGDYLNTVLQLKKLDLSGNLLTENIHEKIGNDFNDNYSITTVELGKTIPGSLQKIIDRNKDLAAFHEKLNALQKTVTLVEQALSDLDKLDVNQSANAILLQLEDAIKLYKTCFEQLVREQNFNINKAIISDAKNRISDIFAKCVAFSLQRPYIFCVNVSDFIEKLTSLLIYRPLMPAQWLIDSTRIYFLNSFITRYNYDYAMSCIERLRHHDHAHTEEMSLLGYESVLTDHIAARKAKTYNVVSNPSFMYELMSKMISDKNIHTVDGAKIMLKYICWFLQDDILIGISNTKKEIKDTLPAIQFDERQINPTQLRDLLQQILSMYFSKLAYSDHILKIKDQFLPLAQQVVSIMWNEKIFLQDHHQQLVSTSISDIFAHENLRDKMRHSLASPVRVETSQQQSIDKKKKAPQLPLASSNVSGASMYPAEKFNKGKERTANRAVFEKQKEEKDIILRKAPQ